MCNSKFKTLYVYIRRRSWWLCLLGERFFLTKMIQRKHKHCQRRQTLIHTNYTSPFIQKIIIKIYKFILIGLTSHTTHRSCDNVVMSANNDVCATITNENKLSYASNDTAKCNATAKSLSSDHKGLNGRQNDNANNAPVYVMCVLCARVFFSKQTKIFQHYIHTTHWQWRQMSSITNSGTHQISENGVVDTTLQTFFKTKPNETKNKKLLTQGNNRVSTAKK